MSDEPIEFKSIESILPTSEDWKAYSEHLMRFGKGYSPMKIMTREEFEEVYGG